VSLSARASTLRPLSEDLFAIVASKEPIARLGQGFKNLSWRRSRRSKSRTDLCAQMFEALLFWKEDESVPHPQDGERRTGCQAEILSELFWYRKLTFFADLGGRVML